MKLEQIKRLMRELQNVDGKVEMWFINVKPGTILALAAEVQREYGHVLFEEDAAVSVGMTGGCLLVRMADKEFYLKEA